MFFVILVAENVALGKPASASSLWSDTHQACTAVNGNIGNTYSIAATSRNCHHSGVSDFKPWWEVDLGQTYTIKNITIFIRDSREINLTYFLEMYSLMNIIYQKLIKHSGSVSKELRYYNYNITRVITSSI